MLLITSGNPFLGTELSAERSPEARRLAETALVWLIYALEGHDIPYVVLGGLVPEILTRDQQPPAPQHLGTTDVDIYVSVHLDLDANLGVLERAMTELGFTPDPGEAGWRWNAAVQGTRVKIEFLCDLENESAQTGFKPVGCRELLALNLRGTRFVGEDWEWEEVTATLPTGEETSLPIRFAGLQGYLMSKVHIARERGADKDYYDLVYTLLFNRLGGPAEAGVSYKGLVDEYDRQVIDHAEACVTGKIHINGIENSWSLLKRGLHGTYVSVQPFHLFRYLDEQVFRYNKRDSDDSGRFVRVLKSVAGRRLTYDLLTGKV